MGGKKSNKSKSKSSNKKTYSKAQQMAKDRIASGKTISQTKAANDKSMRDAAAARNASYNASRGKTTTSSASNKTSGIGPVASGSAYAKSLSTAKNQPSKKTSGVGPVVSGKDYAAAVNSAKNAPTKKTSGVGPVGMSDPFAQPGPTPENTPEADYTSYQPGSFYNQSDTNMNLTNALRSTRNVVTTPARMLGINNQFTNMLIPKSNEAIQDATDQRGPRAAVARRKSGGGTSRIEQQVAATEILPETAAPIGTQEPFNYIQGGTDNSQLSRIQQQSYQDNLSRMMGSYGTMSTGAAGANTQGTGRVAPRLGSFRGRRRLMFAPKSSYMAQGSGPQDLLNRSGLRITSLNT